MVFKRQLSYYIVTIYVPTFMIVCVSWMSFWLDHKSAPARVALTGTYSRVDLIGSTPGIAWTGSYSWAVLIGRTPGKLSKVAISG